MNTLIKTSIRQQPLWSDLLLIVFALGCFALMPRAQAVGPSPDGGYPGGNTAEGQAALLSLTTGGYNTAVGFLSLRTNTEGSFNTATGAGRSSPTRETQLRARESKIRPLGPERF